jgi:hypothetical protein
MNKGTVLAVLGAGLVLGGIGLLGGLDGDTGNTLDAGQPADGELQPEQVKPDIPFAQSKIDNLRLAYKPGACPATVAPKEAGSKGRLPAECAAVLQQDGACMCWTQQAVGEVDEEITSATQLPAADRKRGIVCCPKDPKAGVPEVRWERDEGEVQADCRVFARPINTTGLVGVNTDLDDQARQACAPCPVPGGGDWGQCPHCLCAPGGCAAVCAAPVGP